jgi:hypothetical protein
MPFRAQDTAQGFEQVDGVHYQEHDKPVPVVAYVKIRLVMFLMADWHGKLVDVNGAFLCGHFNGERIYMKIPRGFERFYPGDVVWLLSETGSGGILA